MTDKAKASQYSLETLPFFDGHNDVLMLVNDVTEPYDFFAKNDKNHIDLPRATEARMAGGFFAVYLANPKTDTPLAKTKEDKKDNNKDNNEKNNADEDDSPFLFDRPLPPALSYDYAYNKAISIMATLFRLERSSQNKIKIPKTAQDLTDCLQTGKLATILHFEGAEAIGEDLAALEVFYQAGLRSLGLVWSRPNIFAEGVPFRFPSSPDTGAGLTAAGKKLVKACNRLGIVVDTSHLNEQGFWDVAAISDAPLVATHSNAHAVCASTRNLTDKQLLAIRDTGGVVGLNFGVIFLRPDGRSDLDVGLDVMCDHVDHLANTMGIDHVALGSDFDGVKIPEAIGDVCGTRKLLLALAERGYTLEECEKIAYKNWFAVLERTWK